MTSSSTPAQLGFDDPFKAVAPEPSPVPRIPDTLTCTKTAIWEAGDRLSCQGKDNEPKEGPEVSTADDQGVANGSAGGQQAADTQGPKPDDDGPTTSSGDGDAFSLDQDKLIVDPTDLEIVFNSPEYWPEVEPRSASSPNLGDAQGLVMLLEFGQITRVSSAPFFSLFPADRDAPLWESPEGVSYPPDIYPPPFTPNNFDYAMLVRGVQVRFELPDEQKWTLWVAYRPDVPPRKIVCVRDLEEFLAEYGRAFRMAGDADAIRKDAMLAFIELDGPYLGSAGEYESGSEEEDEGLYEEYDDQAEDEQSEADEPVGPISWLKSRLSRYGYGIGSRPSTPGGGGGGGGAEPSVPDTPASPATKAPVLPCEPYSPLRAVLGKCQKDEPQPIGVAALDTNASRGDVAAGDLEAVLPIASSPTDDEWATACSLLLLNPEEHKDPKKRSIKIPGTEISISPPQYFAAFWMLTSRLERDIHGGVLASTPGTGKTHIAVSCTLLRSPIAYSKNEVEQQWKLEDFESSTNKKPSPKKHLGRNAAAGEACPCNDDLGIQCYATPGGITRRIADVMPRGASLIMAGQTMLDAWVKVFKNGKLSAKLYEPALFHTVVGREVAPDPKLASEKLKGKIRPRARAGFHPKTWNPTVFDGDFEFDWSDKKPSQQPERYIFLVSHVPTKLREAFQVPFHFTPKEGRMEKKKVYGCPVGVQIVDEFHRVMGDTNDVVALAREHKHMAHGDFDFWSVTGTPLLKSVADLKTTLEILHRDDWEKPEHAQHSTRVPDLIALDEAHQKAISAAGTPEDVAAFTELTEKFFGSGLLIRHTAESLFFGSSMFRLQEVRPRCITHYTPDRFIEAAQKRSEELRDVVHTVTGGNWEQIIRNKSTFDTLIDLNIISTFPGAVRFMETGSEKKKTTEGDKEEEEEKKEKEKENIKLKFGDEDIKGYINAAEGRSVYKVDMFKDVLDDLTGDSMKLNTILRIIDTMMDDTKERPRKDASGSVRPPTDKLDMKKMVIVCPRLAEAAFVALALRKQRPDVPSVFYYGGLKASDKATIRSKFESLREGSYRVFVTSFADGGTGLNLFAANYQVHTGPMRLKAHEAQSWARTNRQGQQLPCHHYTLVTDDNPVDRLVIATQARKKFSERKKPSLEVGGGGVGGEDPKGGEEESGGATHDDDPFNIPFNFTAEIEYV